MLELQRITTEYVEVEDRIRLRAADERDETVVLWLTQRLLSQLIQHLLGLIEKQASARSKPGDRVAGSSSLIQGFEQQVAEAELAPEAPVQTAMSSQNWLVQEVDIALSPEGTLVLVLKREMGVVATESAEDMARLTVESKQLRQWLGIIHDQWQRAGWPLGLWPAWMDESPAADASNPLH